VNKLVLLIALIVLGPVILVAAFFGPKLVWPDKSGLGAAGGDAPAVDPPKRVVIPAPADPPPRVAGAVLRPDVPEGTLVTEPLVDKSRTNRYRIKSGDTLFDIAVARYGDSTYVQDILRKNPGLRPEALRVGDQIILPPRRGENPDQRDPDPPRFYVVSRGENLISIARKMYGDSAMYLKIFEANRDQLRNPQSVREGVRLRLPPPPKYE